MHSQDVLVGVSGGIDSFYALIALKEQGYRPVACLLLTGYNDSVVGRLSQLCRGILVPLKTVDIREKFRTNVVEASRKAYLSGRTPNPCSICNADIKFSGLVETADRLGIYYIATGHYALTAKKNGFAFIAKGIDTKKEQSYFLARIINGLDLERLIFPLGNMTKKDVIVGAKGRYGFDDNYTESQDLCFVKKGIKELLSGCPDSPGDIVTTTGEVIGRHKGIHLFTPGQREGISARRPGPWYVVRIDARSNSVIVGDRDSATFKNMYVSDIITSKGWDGCQDGLSVKVRYNQKEIPCQVENADGNRVRVFFDDPVLGIAPGQVAAFYRDGLIVMSGIIEKGGA